MAVMVGAARPAECARASLHPGQLEWSGEVSLDRDHVRSLFPCPPLERSEGVLVTIDSVDAGVRAEQPDEGASEGTVAGANVGPGAGVASDGALDKG